VGVAVLEEKVEMQYMRQIMLKLHRPVVVVFMARVEMFITVEQMRTATPVVVDFMVLVEIQQPPQVQQLIMVALVVVAFTALVDHQEILLLVHLPRLAAVAGVQKVKAEKVNRPQQQY
jgi:hypothetical protein